MSYPIVSPISKSSDFPIRIDMGAQTALRWTEITIQVFDDNNEPVTTATGTITAQVIKSGTTKAENFIENVDLSSDPWSWKPELSTAQSFIFSISGLNANYGVQFTVNNWV